MSNESDVLLRLLKFRVRHIAYYDLIQNDCSKGNPLIFWKNINVYTSIFFLIILFEVIVMGINNLLFIIIFIIFSLIIPIWNTMYVDNMYKKVKTRGINTTIKIIK